MSTKVSVQSVKPDGPPCTVHYVKVDRLVALRFEVRLEAPDFLADDLLHAGLAEAELPEGGRHEPALLLPLFPHPVHYAIVETPPEGFHVPSQLFVLAPGVGVVSPEHVSDELMVSWQTLIC